MPTWVLGHSMVPRVHYSFDGTHTCVLAGAYTVPIGHVGVNKE